MNDIKDFIESYINTYQTCLNTTNPDFLLLLVKSSSEIQNSFLKTLTTSTNNMNTTSKQLMELEEEKKQMFKQMLSGLDDFDETIESSKQVKMHRNLVKCYFRFIRRNVRDFVPKRIQHKMVNLIMEELDNQLNEKVFEPYVINSSFEKVFAEDESVIEDRIQSQKLLDAVNKALTNMIEVQYC